MTLTRSNSKLTSLAIGAIWLALLLAMPAAAQGNGRGPGPAVTAAAAPLPMEQTTALRYMREEEKLARDVYQQLYAKWQLTVFRNISASEDAHFKAIGSLLTRYVIADPADARPAGDYSDATLTGLYKQLLAKGMASAKDALEVGVLIEVTDIADLEKAIAGSDRADIKRVYTNLMNASYSHKEAFETNLELACALAH